MAMSIEMRCKGNDCLLNPGGGWVKWRRMPAKQSPASITAQFELTNALQPVRRAWVQAAGSALGDLGLSTSLATAVILAARCEDKGIRQSALAEEVGVNPGGMVHILDQAEAAGLLQRRDSTDDRRVKFVHVLPEGRRLASKMEKAVAKLRTSLFGDLQIEDIETATRVLRLFEERIGIFLKQERVKR